ncbi:7651_t:CDS:2 [Dentiscutata heterogama]|uniref:7651_t:CDS:1 n=1 Tax=Dentiscutata heterogama TaxID=1316150 RepID=A0ACA9K7Z1_9GLOM|nr:7651_t:CDS:2 [Dentiscutata heterogama]
MTIENNQSHNGKNELSLENEKIEESVQIHETESTSLNDPMNWPIKKKQFIVFIISVAGTSAHISCTIVFPALIQIGVDLKTSQVLTNAIISTFILVIGIAPLGWASYSDTRETRRRAFGGSAVLSIGAGTISDIFIPTKRGRAFGWFYLGPLIGPVIGPTIGGYITQYLGWKYIFWFLSIYGGIILVLIYFALPETFRHTQLSLTTTSPPKERFNPFLPLTLLRYPNLSLAILYISIIYSVIYVQNALVPTTFSAKYNLSPSNVGLVLLSPGIGYVLGSVISGSYSDFILTKSRKKYGSIYPEMRLNSVWLGSVLIPVSLLAYGWFIAKDTHISLPIISMFFFGFGALSVFNGSSTYLIDAFPGRSASSIAVNNCFRSIAASIMSFASTPLENALGTGLLYTLLTVYIILGTSCMVIVYFKGKKWRERFQD